MGGAFIAVADDATAASWNPGGLIQLETPEVSFVVNGFRRTEDIEFGRNPDSSGPQPVTGENFNYLSAAMPFTLAGRNMIVSLNYQHLYDFTRRWHVYFPENSPTPLDSDEYNEIEGQLSAVGLACAMQVTPTLSFGFTLNFWEDYIKENGWKKTHHETNTGNVGPGRFYFASDQWDKYTFKGFNVNLGALWNVNEHLTLGAVFKTPFKARLEHSNSTTAYGYMVIGGVTVVTQPKATTTFSRKEELEMPMSYGIGLAYRFSDVFTVSADIYRTEWQDFILRDNSGKEISPITGRAPDVSDIGPTTQVRFGAEYLFILSKCIVPLRGGIFYDPAPAEGSPDDFFGFSLGSGIAWGRIVFDMAYQYRFANNVGGSILKSLEYSQDMEEHMIYSSLIIHF
jgi:long-subunit fatty acid transport protein